MRIKIKLDEIDGMKDTIQKYYSYAMLDVYDEDGEFVESIRAYDLYSFNE